MVEFRPHQVEGQKEHKDLNTSSALNGLADGGQAVQSQLLQALSTGDSLETRDKLEDGRVSQEDNEEVEGQEQDFHGPETL